MERYLNKDVGSALSNKTYKEIFEYVEQIAKNPKFLNSKGDV